MGGGDFIEKRNEDQKNGDRTGRKRNSKRIKRYEIP